MTIPQASRFDHLLRMTDQFGTFEHARFTVPRPEHGYCTDDMARVLVVASREREPSHAVRGLARLAIDFLERAVVPSGAYRNRMDGDGRFVDEPTLDDCWGRSLWGLGTAIAHAADADVRARAGRQFAHAAAARSTHPRAMAFACVGAADVLTVEPGHRTARQLVADYADVVGDSSADADVDPGWVWPEPRLRYANAVLAEARIAAGHALGRPALRQHGLDMLAWLIRDQTPRGHLSVSPAHGRAAGDPHPAFDQQPIEVSTLADACARAASVDDRAIWPDAVLCAAAWFQGVNDVGEMMWDPVTGGGFDGLHADRVNRNQGAESTLAVLSTMQLARRYSPVRQ